MTDDLETISHCKRLGSGGVFTGHRLFARFRVVLKFQNHRNHLGATYEDKRAGEHDGTLRS